MVIDNLQSNLYGHFSQHVSFQLHVWCIFFSFSFFFKYLYKSVRKRTHCIDNNNNDNNDNNNNNNDNNN